jgi:hypothetical protein
MPARPRHLFLTSPCLIISHLPFSTYLILVISMSQAEGTRSESIDEPRADDDKKVKSRRPASKSSPLDFPSSLLKSGLDTAFRQQRLKAWQ